LTRLPVRQLAYKVNDLEAAAAAHHRRFGSGPFFVMRHIKLASSQHRGIQRPFDHSSAYGQWGGVMVELVVQHNPDPSALHDMFPWASGAEGLHHAALFVDDLDAAIARFAAEDAPLAQLSVTTGGTAFAFVDTRASLGHMLELYEPTPLLTGFYDTVAEAARGWDGRGVIRELGQAPARSGSLTRAARHSASASAASTEKATKPASPRWATTAAASASLIAVCSNGIRRA